MTDCMARWNKPVAPALEHQKPHFGGSLNGVLAMSRTFQALSLAVILVSTLGHAGATQPFFASMRCQRSMSSFDRCA